MVTIDRSRSETRHVQTLVCSGRGYRRSQQPSWERPTMTTTGEIALTHQSGKKVRTLPEAFQETARLRPSAVALRTPGNKVAITWREYADRVRKLAAGFAALGVGPGAPVGVLLADRRPFRRVRTARRPLRAAAFSI